MPRYGGTPRLSAAHIMSARSSALLSALRYLAFEAGPTATGATIALPDGETVYVSRADALALFEAQQRPATAA